MATYPLCDRHGNESYARCAECDAPICQNVSCRRFIRNAWHCRTCAAKWEPILRKVEQARRDRAVVLVTRKKGSISANMLSHCDPLS